MSDLRDAWSVPFLLGFGCGMIASMIAALTYVSAIGADVARCLTEIKRLVGIEEEQKPPRMGRAEKL